MKIWAHVMVKNEARWLWYSVTSIVNYVDKILLWDTGSTDGTIEIEKELVKKYPDKITFVQRDQRTNAEFADVRQEMLNATKSDWFIVVDADEIWYEDSIKNVVKTINTSGSTLESIVVPTINPVGDIFHYQDSSAGRYRFGSHIGHFNLRAVNMNIPGLHSEGIHGVWGWADENNKMIQERGEDKIKFVNSPYLHMTFLPRGEFRSKDLEVSKRSKKLKYEIGHQFPKNFYYPEVLFRTRPNNIPTPWQTMSLPFKLRAFIETPLRNLKRKLWWGRAGY